MVPSTVIGRWTVSWVTSVSEIPRRFVHLGQSEVEELGSAARQHHVAGLQVAVHHSPAVRGIERTGDLDRDLQCLFDWQRTFAQPCFQALAFQILHHQELDRVLAADVVECADVGMIQAGDGPRLALEALGKAAGAYLDGDGAIQAGVARPEDLAHTSGTQRGQDLIGPESSVCRQWHRPAMIPHQNQCFRDLPAQIAAHARHREDRRVRQRSIVLIRGTARPFAGSPIARLLAALPSLSPTGSSIGGSS